MKIRDLVVLLDGSPRDEAVLSTAIGLARRDNAHITGFCPMELLYPATLRTTTRSYSFFAMEEIIAHFDDDALVRAAQIETIFREQIRRNDVRGDWQLGRGPTAEIVTLRARTADLLVLGQTNPADPRPPEAIDMVEDALLLSGRPLLLIPCAGKFDRIGRNVLVGWNGSREAARAVHDALPLIEPGAAVTVLTMRKVNSADEKALPGADIAEHLARHGLTVSAAQTVNDRGFNEADALLHYAADKRADLLVVGGYGHSRAREMILGGVSRGLLRQMTVPVLMSH